MVKAISKKMKRRIRRARKYKKVGAIVNQLTVKRFQNLASVANLDIDGTYLKKSADYLQFTNAGIGDGVPFYGSGSIFASVENIPDLSDFTGLFDRYKICGMRVTFTPINTSTTTEAGRVAGEGQIGCIMHIIKDYDDKNRPAASEAGINTLRQYPNYKTYNLYGKQGRPISIYIRPKVAKTVYAGVTNAYETAAFPWIDMTTDDAEGYGIKFICEGMSHGSTVIQYMKVEACYYLKFKNPR